MAGGVACLGQPSCLPDRSSVSTDRGRRVRWSETCRGGVQAASRTRGRGPAPGTWSPLASARDEGLGRRRDQGQRRPVRTVEAGPLGSADLRRADRRRAGRRAVPVAEVVATGDRGPSGAATGAGASAPGASGLAGCGGVDVATVGCGRSVRSATAPRGRGRSGRPGRCSRGLADPVEGGDLFRHAHRRPVARRRQLQGGPVERVGDQPSPHRPGRAGDVAGHRGRDVALSGDLARLVVDPQQCREGDDQRQGGRRLSARWHWTGSGTWPGEAQP